MESCTPKTPFVKLEENGKASILNYNLPQSTCYQANSYLKIDLNTSFFKELLPPDNNFWEQTEKLSLDDWINKINDEASLAIKDTTFDNSFLLNKKDTRKNTENNNLEYRNTKDNNYSERLFQESCIAEIPISTIASKIKKGFKPVLKQDLLGKIQINYISKPKKFNPEFFIVLHFKMCSYLGNYGAGKTLKTFSLLPGEKTTINIRNWMHNEESKKTTSNILDSLTESSANELQTMLQNTNDTNVALNSSTVATSQFGGGGSASLDLGILQIGGGAEGSSTIISTLNSAIDTHIKNLVTCTDNHVSKSDSLRQTEINTETNNITINEQEETTVRVIENINKSRVLNFIFRELLQEYFTITYLDDISFIYNDGYSENKKVAGLSNLDDLLNEVIEPDNIDTMKRIIYKKLCNIIDYEGNYIQFIEKVDETLIDLINNSDPETISYIRKVKDLNQTYNDKTVNGVILNIKHRVLKTPSLIVDSLLGQGEALDCYNMKLQNTATQLADLDVQKMQQMLDTISGIDDPIKKAELYKKVFTECCDVPQSCGCYNCNSSNETN